VSTRAPGWPGGAATSPRRTRICGSSSATSRALYTVERGRWNLILAGHLHAGQIVLPYGFGKLLLAHPRAKYPEGVVERAGTTMHVSPGLGTTFLPFRFFARPEVTELVLRSS
jgi:predicted MPP superfamily phosphohydrolase